MLVAKKKFAAACMVQIAILLDCCTKSATCRARLLILLPRHNGRAERPLRLQSGSPNGILLVCPIEFFASEERSFECRSAHSNLTVVAGRRRTDFVLV